MKNLLSLFLLLFPLFLPCSSTVQAQCDGVVWQLSNDCGDIQASGGLGPGSPTIFCEGQIVTVVNTSSPGNEITKTYVDWGDGQCQMFNGNPPAITHAYDFPNDTCIGGSGQLTFTVRLGVEKTCAGDKSSFNFVTFPIAVRFKPVGEFTITPSPPCVGTLVTFINKSCTNTYDPTFLWTVNGNPIDSLSSTSFTFTQSGPYTINLKVTNNCGASNYTINTNVLDPPTAVAEIISGVIDSNNVVCIGGGGIVVLNGKNSKYETSYNWSIYPPTGVQWLSDQDTSVVTLHLSQEKDYTVILTVNNPCMEPDKDTIQLIAVDAAALLLGQQPDGCSILEYSPLPPNPDATYTLNGNQAVFPAMLDTGTYIIEATLDNICGNQYRADTFVVSPPVQVSITAPTDSDTFCMGSAPVSLTSDPENVIWEGEHVEGSTFNPEASGSFIVRAVYAQGSSCETTDYITVFVNGLVAEAEDIKACPGLISIPLQGSPADGVWSCSACPGCIQNGQFVFGSYSGAYPVPLSYQVSDGECTASVTINLDVVHPKAAFAIAAPLCAGMPIGVTTDGAVADVFVWRIDSQDAGQPPFAGLPSGTYLLEQFAELSGCRDSISQPFTVIAPPAGAEFSASPVEGCSPLSVTFTPADDERTDVQYTWDFTNGNPDSADTWMPAGQVVFSNTTNQVMYFPVTFVAKNACGGHTKTIDIQVNSNPFAELGIDSTSVGCSPLSVIITNRSSGGADSCLLSISDGSSSKVCFDSIYHTFFADEQVMYYILHLWTGNECGVSEYYDTIVVFPPGIEAFFEIDDETICPNAAVQFFDASTPKPVSVQWNFGDGGFSNDPNPSHVFEAPNKTHEVVLRVSTGCGYDTIRHFITTLSEPVVQFETPPSGCEEGAVHLENLSPEDLFAYYWQYNDGATDSTHYHSVHTFIDTGWHVVRLTAVDWNGCSKFLEKNIQILPKPIVGFFSDPSEGCPPLSVQFTDTSHHVNRWYWEFGDGTTSSAQHPGKLYDAGEHSVKLVASWEGVCIDSASVPYAVRVDICDYYIPNIFAPSSSGDNAVFTVFGSPALERIDLLRVFNHWGGLVYEGIDLPPNQVTGWDGTYRDKLLNPGVFVYYTELRFVGNVIKKIKGDVTLIR